MGAFAIIAACALAALATPAGAEDLPGPEQVVIGTVPPLEGVRVTVDGRTYTTGVDGTAVVGVADRRDVGERVEVVDREFAVDATQRARFSRVFGGSGDSVRVAYDIDYLTRFGFRSRAGPAIEPGEIDKVTLRSAMGAVLELDEPGEAVWLHGLRAISSPAGPLARPIQWSVEDVAVRGASVVHRSATRFLPSETRDVELELLYFAASFDVRDALLGGVVERGEVALTYPDGGLAIAPIGPGGKVDFPSLPRGSYTLAVRGVGPAMARPLSVTRDQQTELEVYTWTNVAMAATGGLLFVVLPLAWGLALRRRQRRARSAVAHDPVTAMGDDDPAVGVDTSERVEHEPVEHLVGPTHDEGDRRRDGRASLPLRTWSPDRLEGGHRP